MAGGHAQCSLCYSVKLFPHPPIHWNYDYDVLQLVCVLHMHCSTVSCPVKGTGTGPGLNVHWLIKDMLRRGYKDRVMCKNWNTVWSFSV